MDLNRVSLRHRGNLRGNGLSLRGTQRYLHQKAPTSSGQLHLAFGDVQQLECVPPLSPTYAFQRRVRGGPIFQAHSLTNFLGHDDRVWYVLIWWDVSIAITANLRLLRLHNG